MMPLYEGRTVVQSAHRICGFYTCGFDQPKIFLIASVLDMYELFSCYYFLKTTV